jgi:MYXO-CTERM domain-containing protein
MISRSLIIAACAILLLASSTAQAQDYNPPFIELGLGATNIEATTGNSGLTIGVSQDGDLTVFSWPSPSYWDHIHYMTTNDPDARTQPRFGAGEQMGAFAGLAYTTTETTGVQMSWLREWDRQVAFTDMDTAVVQTTFENTELGVTITQYDIIPQDHDVLVRRFVVEKTASSTLDSAWLLGYENFSPGLSKVEQIPLLDALIDHKNDFLAVWDDASGSIVHFHPADTGVDETFAAVNQPLDRDFGPLGTLLESATIDETAVQDEVTALDTNYGEGVYIAYSSMPAPVEYQIGEDPTDTCAQIDELATNIQTLQERFPDKSLPAPPEAADLVKCGDFDPLETPRTEEGWMYSAQSAYDDAADGELSGNPLAGAQVNAAIKVPLNFNGNTAEASLHFALGDTHASATSELEWARNQDAATLQGSVEDEHRNFVNALWIPPELDEEMTNFMKRTFLNMRVGTDRETGAIVASISRQPSYQLDWPRDGAFFNIALDIAGQNELVTRRMDFYSDTMRKEEKSVVPILNQPVPGWPDRPNERDFPPNSWEMNYYADGEVGGNIRLEIDNTALLVWAYVYHVGHLEGDARDDYIQRVWPTVEAAADWLAEWREAETGLNWWANEDDHAEYTQGLQGSSTTYGALVSAARLARHIGEDEAADRWLTRAGELKNATLEYMYVEGEGFYGLPGKNGEAPRKLGAGSPYWLSWPTGMFPKDDERFRPQLISGLEKQLGTVRGDTAGGQYPTKVAISAALVLEESEGRAKAFEIAERLAKNLANPRTFTLGEHYSKLDTDDDPDPEGWVNGVSTPHLWSMSLVYLTAVAYHHPEKFDAYDDVLPEVTVPDTPLPNQGGEDAGGDASGDTGPSVDAGADTGSDIGDGDEGEVSGGGGGCDCTTTDSAPSSSAMLAVLLLLATRLMWRRRR